jgi:hypothetical protein
LLATRCKRQLEQVPLAKKPGPFVAAADMRGRGALPLPRDLNPLEVVMAFGVAVAARI